MAPDSEGPDQPTAPEPSSLPDHLPIQITAPIPQVQSETSRAEKAQISLDRANEAEKSIGSSNSWQGIVEKIKWVTDTLSPVAGVRVINILFVYAWLRQLALPAPPDCTDGVWSAFGDPPGTPDYVIVGRNADAMFIRVIGTLETVSTRRQCPNAAQEHARCF